MKNSSKQHRYVLFAHYGNEEIENVQALCFNLKWQASTHTNTTTELNNMGCSVNAYGITSSL